MAEITYLKGNALEPTDNVIVAHICNNVRVWGGGFVLAVDRNVGLEPKSAYFDGRRTLGELQLVAIEDKGVENFWVANMIAQNNTRGLHDKIDYDALETCIHELGFEALSKGCEVHMPRIGCGLAGSTWQKILPYVQKLADVVPVTVFDLP